MNLARSLQLVDKMQQAGKIGNFQQVCRVLCMWLSVLFYSVATLDAWKITTNRTSINKENSLEPIEQCTIKELVFSAGFSLY